MAHLNYMRCKANDIWENLFNREDKSQEVLRIEQSHNPKNKHEKN